MIKIAPGHTLLADLFFNHAGNSVDKWEHYLDLYQVELGRLVQAGRPVRLLEIGVQNGGSLELWSQMLPEGSIIRGVDVDSSLENIRFASDRIQIDVVDATSPKLADLLGNEMFDVIIDDGSHLSEDIIKSFGILFLRNLKAGGIYIIEDLHATYSEHAAHGDDTPAMNFLKRLVDALNADYIRVPPDRAMSETTFLRQMNRVLARTTFYDSAVVIEKLTRPKLEPFRRIVSGTVSTVVRHKDWLSAVPRQQLNSALVSPHCAEILNQELLQKMNELEVTARAGQQVVLEDQAKLQRELKLARETILALSKDLETARDQVVTMRQESARSTETLNTHRMTLTQEICDARERISSLTEKLAETELSGRRHTQLMKDKLDRAYDAWSVRGVELACLKRARF